jgi:hypothetical protein
MPYLTPDDPHAFDDYPLAPVPPPEYGFSDTPCPTCKGHGGWNLKVNSSPLHNYPDTPENRHLYSHFRASCGSCWGWGYLAKGQTCAHEWTRSRSIGNCLSVWTCGKCGAEREVDSSG